MPYREIREISADADSGLLVPLPCGAARNLPGASALLAHPRSGLGHVRVFVVIRVALRAVGHAGIAALKSVAAQQVLATCHRLQMPGVDARWVTAQVIKVQACGDLSNEGQVRESVRADWFPRSQRKGPVSELVTIPRPNPTATSVTINSHLAPKACLDVLRRRADLLLEVEIPMNAKPLRVHRTVARGGVFQGLRASGNGADGHSQKYTTQPGCQPCRTG